jgi:hypothetical protein
MHQEKYLLSADSLYEVFENRKGESTEKSLAFSSTIQRHTESTIFFLSW